MKGTALVFPVFVLYVVTIGRVSMTATDADASRSLFDAVAEMTGLTPMVRDIEARLAADVE